MTQSLTITENQPPPVGGMGGSIHSWERSVDPWHQDAFPEGFKHAGSEGQRKSGWSGLDASGNEIAFVADGDVVQMQEPDLNIDAREAAWDGYAGQSVVFTISSAFNAGWNAALAYHAKQNAEAEKLAADDQLDSLPEETEVTIRKRGGIWPCRIYTANGDLQAYCHGNTPTEAISEAVSAYHKLDKQAEGGEERK